MKTKIQANIDLLNKQMENNESLNKLLSTTALELPYKYKFFLPNFYRGWQDTTLYMMIDRVIHELPSNHVYFFMEDEKITGWYYYNTITDCMNEAKENVNEIVMFSFDVNKHNPVSYRDFSKLVKELLKECKCVSWTSYPRNPANKIYEKIVEKYMKDSMSYIGHGIPFNYKMYYSIEKKEEKTTFVPFEESFLLVKDFVKIHPKDMELLK